MASRAPKETPQSRGHRTRRLARGEDAPPPKLRRVGAPKGPQRAGVAAKESLLSAFEKMGGVAGLVKWGKKNPTEFYRIWARLLPKDEAESVRVIGVEDLLRQLDAGDAERDERLESFNIAGSALGLAPPAPATEA